MPRVKKLMKYVTTAGSKPPSCPRRSPSDLTASRAGTARPRTRSVMPTAKMPSARPASLWMLEPATSL